MRLGKGDKERGTVYNQDNKQSTVGEKIMSKLSSLLWLSFAFSLLTFEAISNVAVAQMRGENSDRFFRQGNQVMEQQIQELQRESIRQQQEAQGKNDDKIDDDSKVDNQTDLVEEKEEKKRELDTPLEMKKPSELEIKENPDNPSALDDNLPESPEEEVKRDN